MAIKDIAIEVTAEQFLRMTNPEVQEQVKEQIEEGLVAVMYILAADDGINPNDSFILTTKPEHLVALISSRQDDHVPFAYTHGKDVPSVLPDLDIPYYIATITQWLERMAEYATEKMAKSVLE